RITTYTLDQVLFEALSAFGTVGLSTGITTALPDEAKWVLTACMYVGRLGPMTLGAALAVRSRLRMVQLPYERPIGGRGPGAAEDLHCPCSRDRRGHRPEELTCHAARATRECW